MTPLLSKCRVVDLPRIADPRGNLTFVEGQHIPFSIKRVYYLYDIPAGAERGGHAHRALQQVIIAASGSFEVVLDDGLSRQSIFLNNPAQGLVMPTMIWRELQGFSSGAVCLVLASENYDEGDYYRDYEEYRQARLAEGA